MSANTSTRAVLTALTMNGVITLIKGVVAFLSGSAAMMAEAIHSLADSGNQLLLLFGMSRSRRPADANHPFGHGKEEYYWSNLVAIIPPIADIRQIDQRKAAKWPRRAD